MFLFYSLTFGQISGRVIDSSNRKPIPYVNVWVKNKLLGATTGDDGVFFIDKAKIGDILVVSSLGYSKIELQAEIENEIALPLKIEELDEVVITPMRNTSQNSIESFGKVKRNRPWYNNGFYSLARFYEYKREYQPTPFIKQVGFVTNCIEKDSAVFIVRLVKVDHNGQPSGKGLIEK